MASISPATTGIPFVKTVHCSGKPLEIGFTHGSSVSAEIHANVETYTQFFAQTAKCTWEQARERAVAHFLPTLEDQWPDILEEMRGIAEGAGGGLTRDDILTLNVRTEIAFTNYADGCTSISQSAEDGKMFLAQTWDMVPELWKGMVFLHIRPQGSDIAMVFLGEAGIVGKIGMNSAGFGLCMNALRSAAYNRNKCPVHVMSRRLLQFATSVDSALTIIEKFGLAASVNYNLADKSGKQVDIECSPIGTSSILPQHGYLVHTNHLYGPERSPEWTDHPSADSFTRLMRMQELTESDRRREEPTTFESLRARFSDEDNTPVGICRALPPGAKGLEALVTLSTILMELSSCTGKVTIGRPCDDLPVVDWSF